MTWYVDSRGNASDRPPWATGLPLRRVPTEPARKPINTTPGWSPGEIRALTVLFGFLGALLVFGLTGVFSGPPCDVKVKRAGPRTAVEVKVRWPHTPPQASRADGPHSQLLKSVKPHSAHSLALPRQGGRISARQGLRETPDSPVGRRGRFPLYRVGEDFFSTTKHERTWK